MSIDKYVSVYCSVGVVEMNYKSLNENQRQKMNQISDNDFTMEWENPSIFDIFIGKLPSIHHYQKEDGVCAEISTLEKIYSQYNFFTSDRNKFIEDIKNSISAIHNKMNNWYGLNIYEVEECIRQQEFCLISGEGGIGKSFFLNV